MSDPKQEIQNLTGIPKEIIDEEYDNFMGNSTWGITHQKQDLPYDVVRDVKIFKVTKVLSKDLEVGDIFSFLNPEEYQSTPFNKVKRKEDFRCLVYKIN